MRRWTFQEDKTKLKVTSLIQTPLPSTYIWWNTIESFSIIGLIATELYQTWSLKSIGTINCIIGHSGLPLTEVNHEAVLPVVIRIHRALILVLTSVLVVRNWVPVCTQSISVMIARTLPHLPCEGPTIRSGNWCHNLELNNVRHNRHSNNCMQFHHSQC